MRKFWLMCFVIVLFCIGGVFADEQINVYYFYSTGCSHCANVADSGVLERAALMENVSLEKFNLYESQENRDLFNNFCDEFNIVQRGWPFVVIERNDKYTYLIGDVPIIENLEKKILSGEGVVIDLDGISVDKNKGVTIGSILVAAVIDSINPCAFGVLIFLMASLLGMGSARRALRAGLIYSFVVFAVYFFVGWGFYNVINSFSSSSGFYYFYLVVAIVIFLLGLLQLKDIFWYGKGITLRISSRAKPIVESFIAKGNLISIIVLGVIVSLFELPCTGEIYIGILTLMSIHRSFGLGYLLIYNLIFVLPLIVLTYLIYRGTSTEKLQNWTVSNRKYMKLISGLLLLGLSIYIFIRAVGFV